MSHAKNLCLLATLISGCTFEPGRWFATLEPSLNAAYLPRADRDAGEGWQRLSNDFQVRVTELHLELGEIALLAAAAPGGAVKLDPARPPPGYTLCHNGHCHHESGRLVPYAEIEAELAGGGDAIRTRAVVSLPVGGPLQLATPVERSLTCRPSCNLDRLTIVRATVPVRALSVAGLVRDARTPPRLPAESPFRWELAPGADAGAAGPPPVLDAALDLPADHEHPPRVALRFQLALAASLFDGVELGALAGGAADPAAEARLLQNLREGAFLTASVNRDDF
jgi:hypothetical protein